MRLPNSVIRHIRDRLNSSLSFRIGAVLALITMLITLFIGSASYWTMRYHTIEEMHIDLEHHAAIAEQRATNFLNSIIYDVSSMSKNTIMANALVDSAGRDIYLLPFLRGYKLPENIPFTLTLCDFQGVPIGSSAKTLPRPYKKPSMIKQVFNRESAYIELVADQGQNIMTLAYPVFLGSISKPEGMLIMEADITNIFAILFQSEIVDEKIHVYNGSTLLWGKGLDDKRDFITVEKYLSLKEPLNSLNIRIEVGKLGEKASAPLKHMTLVYLSAGILTLILTVWLSRVIALRMTGRLSDLSMFANRIVERGISDTVIDVKGKDEVERLASAFNDMIVKLRGSYETLERRVEERTLELETSERKYRNLADNSLMGIFQTTVSGEIIYVNKAVLDMLEFGSPEEMMSLNIVTAYKNPKVRETLIDRLRESGNVSNFEIESLTKTGKPKNIILSAALDGDIISGTIIDITGRKIMEEYLRELNKNLRERIKEGVARQREQEQLLIHQSRLAAMGEMISAIAHQWRQPLTALGLIVQDIKDAYEYGELTKEYIDGSVEKSMKQLQFMSRTIDDFRNFFRLEKEKSLFDVKRAVGEVLSLISAQLKSDNIAYRITCHEHNRTFEDFSEIIQCGEMTITGYKSEFEQVILNIVNNAKDAIFDARERGLIAAGESGLLSFDFERSGDKVLIRISDNGGGIPEEIIGRIFDPYFTTREQGKGTGIGLYMSKVIIENMGGRLYAENIENGAMFTIELKAGDR